MSRAFVREKDVDYLEVLPERPISEHSNDVTETGQTQIEHALAAASEAYIAAQASTDRAALAAAGLFAIGLPGARRRVSYRNQQTGLKSGSAPQ
jgi:hypothetical protein